MEDILSDEQIENILMDLQGLVEHFAPPYNSFLDTCFYHLGVYLDLSLEAVLGEIYNILDKHGVHVNFGVLDELLDSHRPFCKAAKERGEETSARCLTGSDLINSLRNGVTSEC